MSMKIMVPAVDAVSGKLLVDPVDEQELGEILLGRLPVQGPEVAKLSFATATGTTFRSARERPQQPDAGDPTAVGWTYLIASSEPERDRIAEAIGPLAKRRGMKDVTAPFEFDGRPPEEWTEWLLEHYWKLEEQAPHYVLIVGGPDRVPFHFQALLDSVASVGRLAFDDIGDLSTYVGKVIRVEDGSSRACANEAVVFSTDGGLNDPTHYSRRYMAEPIAQQIAQAGSGVTKLLAEDATRDRLLTTLAGRQPALLYSASHGAGLPRGSQEDRERLNGAVVCQGEPAAGLELFSAADVPEDPFLEGGIFFQFACFGYGTPAESDFNHWLGEDRFNADRDFVAALPNKLLAHPRGPIAYVGHVDLAWLHGFADPDAPDLLEAWSPRLAPFNSAVRMLLEPQPIGLAMQEMNKRFDIGNAVLATTFDRQERGKLPQTDEVRARLVDAFITRSDAQNYLVLGDPAVHVRIDG
jgi:hypothetical protein